METWVPSLDWEVSLEKGMAIHSSILALPLWLRWSGDLGSIPGLGRSPGEGHGNPLQYSGPENPMDRRAWWVTVHGVTQSRTQLSGSAQHAAFCAFTFP